MNAEPETELAEAQKALGEPECSFLAQCYCWTHLALKVMHIALRHRQFYM